MPWKNGGGITHEVFRVPAMGDPFLWRVSIAQIDASGPFSQFDGFTRTLVLLQGAGVRLTFGPSGHTDLCRSGDIVVFDGALPAQCDLKDGPCTDLNLMVSTTLPDARAGVEHLRGGRTLPLGLHETMLVFAVDGAVSVDWEGGDSIRLQPWDLAVVTPTDCATVGPAMVDSPPPLVFFATFDDNPTPSLGHPWPPT